MKTLQDYIVDDRLYVSDTGPEAKVGDQVKLFLDQEANPDFPEFILGVIQHPITRVNCESSTSYVIEYDEADLLGAASLIRPGDVINATVVTDTDVLTDAIALKAPIASPTFTGTVTIPAIVAPIVGITGTKAQFDSAVTDGNIGWLNSTNVWTGVYNTFEGSVVFGGSSEIVFTVGTVFTYDAGVETEHRAALGIPTYSDLTAANVALNAGDIYYDTALEKLRAATA